MRSKDNKKSPEFQLAIKRRWQIALRRYLIEKNPSNIYAPYFGLPSSELRKWIELQFYDDMSLENFGQRWNLSQRVPALLFDLSDEKDMTLCWNFLNIIIQDSKAPPESYLVTLLSAKSYFKNIHERTGLKICQAMIQHIESRSSLIEEEFQPTEIFLESHLKDILSFGSLDADEFLRINKGESLKHIMIEREIISKYGS